MTTAGALPRSSNRQPRNALLEITQVLQTTLDIEELITLFSAEVARLLDHSGVQYQNTSAGISHTIGQRTLHNCEYRLMMGPEYLGNMTFMRRTRCSEDEANQLENLVCVLMHPLRNALRFHAAVESAHTDPLTGVCNRAALDKALPREFSIARRQDSELSLLMIDIDHFKAINDQHGHVAGDCVLRDIAQRIGDTIRATDILFRYGGEEFLVVLSNTDGAGTELLGERLRRALADMPCTCDETEIPVTISLGGATLNDSESIQDLLKRADDSLYQAKDSGRNRLVISTESDSVTS